MRIDCHVHVVGTGTGGSDLDNIRSEFTNAKFVRGTCGMARSQSPHSANSQFFIMFAPGDFLNGQYTVWGMVTEGMVKRGNKVRLLRDNVVIHEGTLKTLRRFKDEVREVQNGYECGMAFENYDDIKVGDVIECFDVEEVKPTL